MSPARAARRAVLLAAAAAVALTGCSYSVSSGSGPTSATPSSSGSLPPKAQWCTTYATVTKVLAETGATQEGAQTAVEALKTFRQLWDVAPGLDIVTAEEGAANLRAVDAYIALEQVIADGAAETSAQAKAAQAALQQVTESDRELLKGSATKVLATCGGVTATPSASAG